MKQELISVSDLLLIRESFVGNIYQSNNKNDYSKSVLTSRKKRIFEFKEHDNDIVINGFSFIEDYS